MSAVLLLLRALRWAEARAAPSARGLRTAAPRRAFAKELFLGTLRKVGPPCPGGRCPFTDRQRGGHRPAGIARLGSSPAPPGLSRALIPGPRLQGSV